MKEQRFGGYSFYLLACLLRFKNLGYKAMWLLNSLFSDLYYPETILPRYNFKDYSKQLLQITFVKRVPQIHNLSYSTTDQFSVIFTFLHGKNYIFLCFSVFLWVIKEGKTSKSHCLCYFLLSDLEALFLFQHYSEHF